MARRRWHVLAELSRHYGVSRMVEVGVKAGVNIDNLLTLCPNLTVIAVDPWAATDGYVTWSDSQVAAHQAAFDAVAAKYDGRVSKVNLPSVYGAQTVPYASLGMVFIDANHTYEAVTQDIAAWLPKLKSGGVMAGHDYGNANKYGQAFGVTQAVRDTFLSDFETDADSVWWTVT